MWNHVEYRKVQRAMEGVREYIDNVQKSELFVQESAEDDLIQKGDEDTGRRSTRGGFSEHTDGHAEREENESEEGSETMMKEDDFCL